jgi:hypothetical protein
LVTKHQCLQSVDSNTPRERQGYKPSIIAPHSCNMGEVQVSKDADEWERLSEFYHDHRFR